MIAEYQGKIIVVPMGFIFFKKGEEKYICISPRGDTVGEYHSNLDYRKVKEMVAQDIDTYLDTLAGIRR